MAGGKGTRFWPRSTLAAPKQFLPLISGETMIQATYRRFLQWIPREHIYVATAQRYVPLLGRQLPELDAERMIVEPEQKDTGPSVALAAHYFLKNGIDDVVVMTPSDQYIADGDALREALCEAAEAAESVPSVVTLGIVPTRPETGYGYMVYEEKPFRNRVHRVKSFIEKPNLPRAEKLYRQPHTVWNSGIFIWRPSTIAHYMGKLQPDIWDALKNISDDPAELARTYSALPSISVDYAVMEKAEQLFTIPVDFAWDDIGLWTSLERFHASDGDGNIANGDVHPFESSGNIVFSDKKTLIIGVRDLIIVSTEEGLLVCAKSEEHKIKQALAAAGGL
jgi:mannose-1-phosphate guanylyltransferase